MVKLALPIYDEAAWGKQDTGLGALIAFGPYILLRRVYSVSIV